MNINFGLHSPTQKGEASSSCAISPISDVTLPTRLGLLPSTTSFVSLMSPFSFHINGTIVVPTPSLLIPPTHDGMLGN